MPVIKITNLSKDFRIYLKNRKCTTLKEVFISRIKGRKNYEEFRALDEISLAVEEGESIGIIGENGSGKTTLLKLISGILVPTKGSIRVSGSTTALLELGTGFQAELTGRENIYLNASILGLGKRKIDKLFDEIVKFSELEKFIETPISKYSSGMYMRLGFSIAVNVNPDILLIDDILAVGDEYFRRKCFKRMEDFKRAGKTIILVTHDLNYVSRWCHRALWLSHGKVKEVGYPDKVIQYYEAETMQREKKNLEETKEQDKKVTSIHVEGKIPDQDLPSEIKKFRNGTREIEIISVKLFDGNRNEKYAFDSGEKMEIEIDYKINKTTKDPIFGIGIFNEKGIRCYGTNTFIEKINIPLAKEDGKITMHVENLDFIKGIYYLDVAAHAKDGYDYDYQRKFYSFSVKPRGNADFEDVGIFRPRHKWVVEQINSK